MINRRPIIGVMGSSNKPWEEWAHPVGEAIAEAGFHLLTGAGAGVMSEVAKAFTAVDDRKGVSLGILPTSNYDGEQLSRMEFPNPYIELPIITRLDVKAERDINPYSRNNVNIMTSNAVIVLPGDHGTQNETSLALLYGKPVLLFGPEKAFEKFPDGRVYTDDEKELKEFLETIKDKT